MFGSRVRTPLLASLAALSLAAVACRTDDDTPQGAAFGTYELTLVNGDSLPVQTGELDDILYDVLAGTIIANSDQTCEFRHTFRLTSLQDLSVRVESEAEPCTWQLVGNGFHARFSGGSYLSGFLAQNALWFDFPANDGGFFRFMYQRVGEPPK